MSEMNWKFFAIFLIPIIAVLFFGIFLISGNNIKENQTTSYKLITKVSIGIGANFYADSGVKNLLRAGDQLMIPANRKQAEVSLAPERVKMAVDTLNGLETSNTGVEKAILFSSVSDLKTYADLLPPDLTWIAYNFEGGMTPKTEQSDPVGSVVEFARLAHSLGKKMSFGPTHNIYDNLEKTGKLTEILKSADKVIYQGQNVAPVMSEEEFISFIQKKYAYIQNANQSNGRSVKFYLQLWNPQQSPETMVRIFNKLSSSKAIDSAGTGGLKSAADVITVLSGLR